MVSRNLKKAKEAFKNRDVSASIKAHKENCEPHNLSEGKYIKNLIYGGLDGTITTFAVVAGVAGASLSGGIVLIMEFANLIADGLSMAIGDYLSTKAEIEYQQLEKQRESWEVEHFPEGERQEIIEIYKAKGLSEEDSIKIVDIFSKNKETWINVMMVEELGIVEDNQFPIKNAAITFLSFLVFGFIPLIAYVSSKFIPGMGDLSFILAAILTGVTLFVLGALKVKVTVKNWFTSGLEMLLVGGIAAIAAFLIGKLLSGLA